MYLNWFWELNAARKYSEWGGPEPFTFTELDAWTRLMRIALTPFEIRLLKAMDVAFIVEMGKRDGGN